jgi:hypothetical protein
MGVESMTNGALTEPKVPIGKNGTGLSVQTVAVLLAAV